MSKIYMAHWIQQPISNPNFHRFDRSEEVYPFFDSYSLQNNMIRSKLGILNFVIGFFLDPVSKKKLATRSQLNLEIC